MNIIKCALQAGGIWIWKCWFLYGGRKTGEPGENPRSKDENQQKTQPTYDTGTENRTWATLVGGECSHHCAIPAPTYHREQEIKRQLDHLDVFICSDFFSVHIDQVLQEYDNLKRNLDQVTKIKESKLCAGQSVAGWRMENVRQNISLIRKNEIITKNYRRTSIAGWSNHEWWKINPNSHWSVLQHRRPKLTLRGVM